jgi:phosphoribosylformimino-5-aminoimidazole carboxamide ribotide isomerase
MIEIIPAIDIIEGKCVRLQQGEYSTRIIYDENPLEVAKIFEDSGLKRLHIVDLEGAKAKKVINLKILEKIASGTNLVIDFGGGIKTEDDLAKVFSSGASFATIGSIAVIEPSTFRLWLNKYGSDRIIAGADVKDDKLAISGWTSLTDVHLFDFIKDNQEAGVKYILCTDISKDGMLMGSSISLYKNLKEKFPDLNIIASGGITNINEIEELNELNLYGVIVGKAIYEGMISLEELSKFVLNDK